MSVIVQNKKQTMYKLNNASTIKIVKLKKKNIKIIKHKTTSVTTYRQTQFGHNYYQIC